MKNVIAIWLLCGALSASTALNVYKVTNTPEPAIVCQAQAVAVPVCDKVCDKVCCNMAGKLCLTASQQQRFADCCPNYARKCQQLHNQVDVLVIRLEQAVRSEKPDTATIDMLVEKIGQIRAAELKNRVQNIMVVRETLTPQQLEQLTAAFRES